MRTIPLTHNKIAILDDEDFDRINQYGSWHFDRYAKRVDSIWNKVSKTYDHRVVYMHREVVNAPNRMVVDHINGDKLDNRKANLRVCTMVENGQNRNVRKNKYLGVSWDKRRCKWKAVIGFHYQCIDIGRFDTAEAAALAYNQVVIQLHGNTGRLNEVSNGAIDRGVPSTHS